MSEYLSGVQKNILKTKIARFESIMQIYKVRRYLGPILYDTIGKDYFEALEVRRDLLKDKLRALDGASQ